MENGDSDGDGDQSEDESTTAASSKWPWEAVRNKLVEALTEMTVLTDVISIATKDCGKDAQVCGMRTSFPYDELPAWIAPLLGSFISSIFSERFCFYPGPVLS